MKKTILVAEDDKFIRKLFRLNLTRDDWDIRVAINGQEAIESMDEQPPDMLLLDLLMPVIDGFGVLTHMRERGYHIPTIILSNLSQQMDRERSQQLGAIGYYVKSDLDIDELVASMESILQA